MLRGLYAAASGLQVASEQQEVTAYNLAEMSAPGYRQRGVFFETFDRVLGRLDPPTGDLTGARTAGVYHDFRPGPLQLTDNPFDLALSEPDQFFTLRGPNGPLYTRNGQFRLTAEGRLVSPGGYPLIGEDGPIEVPAETRRVDVGVDGTVSADGQQIGRIRPARFADLRQLTAAGPTLYTASPGVRPQDAEGRVLQGYLDKSNVEPADAMVRMIFGARFYDAAQRSLRAISESIQLNTRPFARRGAMIKALFTSSTGMNAQSTALDNTANNLANVNTTGFKRGETTFQDLVYVTAQAPGTTAAQGLELPTGLQIGSGSRVSGITKTYTQGGLVATQNPLDIAIEGQGFLQVTLPNGEIRYTRDGGLRLNASGTLVTSDGFFISPQITIPAQATAITIGTDGTVSAINAGATNATTVLGQLTLTRFLNPSGLSAEGRNLMAETAASGPPIVATPGQNGVGFVQQGFLERSNVDVVTELVSLIITQRAYEFNTRAVRTADNMLASTTDLIR